jgi:hypothetical protein
MINGVAHVLKSGGHWGDYEDRREVDRILDSPLALGIGRTVWSDVAINEWNRNFETG